MKLDWDSVYGQNNVKEILSRLIKSSRVPHAFLFQGPDGVGKFFLALNFAKIVNKLHSPGNPQISSFINNLAEPYIKFIIPLPRGKNETDDTGAIEKLTNEDIQKINEELEKKRENPYYTIKINRANNIKINSIREITKFLSLSYEDVKYRFIIISDAHLMKEESQNALLKNLEEPPSGVIFILLTPYPDNLRETIKSRCWQINFQPLNEKEIKDILVKYFNIEEKIAEEVAPFSGGSVTKGLELIDNDFENLKEKTISVMRYSFGGKFHSALNELSPFISTTDSSLLKLLIQMIITWLNDIQKYKHSSRNHFYFESHLETIEKFNSKFPDIELNDITSRLDKFVSITRNNINPNLIGLNVIYELASLTGRITS